MRPLSRRARHRELARALIKCRNENIMGASLLVSNTRTYTRARTTHTQGVIEKEDKLTPPLPISFSDDLGFTSAKVHGRARGEMSVDAAML